MIKRIKRLTVFLGLITIIVLSASSLLRGQDTVPSYYSGYVGETFNPPSLSQKTLFRALYVKDFKSVKQLVVSGSNVNAPNEKYVNPLHFAVVYSSPEIIEYLVQHGANVNAVDGDGFTPLRLAVSKDRSLEIIDFLVRHGAELDVSDEIDCDTPLNYAIRADRKDVALYLIKAGANVHYGDTFKYTPLHLASRDGHIEVVKALLAKRADPNAKNYDGWTSLHAAIIAHQNYPIEFKWEGLKQLYWKVVDNRENRKNIVLLLIDSGANVNAHDRFSGLTPLHYAAEFGNAELVQILLDKGADPKEKDLQGFTPLDKAKEKHHIKIMKFLEK